MLWVSLAAPPGESLVTQRHLFCSRRSSFSARCSSSTLTRSLRQHLLLWSARAHLAAAASAAQRAACRAAGRAFPHSCRTAVAQLHVVPAAAVAALRKRRSHTGRPTQAQGGLRAARVCVRVLCFPNQPTPLPHLHFAGCASNAYADAAATAYGFTFYMQHGGQRD